MKRLPALLFSAVIALLCAGCGGAPEQTDAAPQQPAGLSEQTGVPGEAEQPEPADETGEHAVEKTLKLSVGDTEVSVVWEDNASVEALAEVVRAAPLTVEMSMYGGFEQVGPIGRSLPRDDRQTTASAGDIVLYAGSQIVVFYGSNSWSYTRLGRITDKSASELDRLLGNGDVTITLSWE